MRILREPLVHFLGIGAVLVVLFRPTGDEELSPQLEATDLDLQAWFSEHRESYRVDEAFTFRHIYLNPDCRGDDLGRDIEQLLEQLSNATEEDVSGLGDVLLLPDRFESRTRVEQTFGPPSPRLSKSLPPVPGTDPSSRAMASTWCSSPNASQVASQTSMTSERRCNGTGLRPAATIGSRSTSSQPMILDDGIRRISGRRSGSGGPRRLVRRADVGPGSPGRHRRSPPSSVGRTGPRMQLGWGRASALRAASPFQP